MLKISEKTIDLKSPKSTREEIIVKKEGVKEDEDKEFTFDEIIEIPEEQFKEVEKDTDAVTFFDDELSSDDEDKEPEDREESKKKEISPEEDKEDKEDTTTEEEVNLVNMIDNKLLLDMLAEKGARKKKDKDIDESAAEDLQVKESDNEKTILSKPTDAMRVVKLKKRFEFF